MKLKTTPQEFKVIEHIDMPSGGAYYLYKVEKTGVTTTSFEKLARFAGLKDSQSVSVQYATSEKPVDHPNFTFVKKVPRHIRSSDIVTNEFKIVLRDVHVGKYKRCPKSFTFTNFFGEQRFWSARPVVDINDFFVHHLVTDDIDRAVKTACTHGGIGVAARRRQALAKKWGDVALIEKLPPKDWARQVITAYQKGGLGLDKIPVIDRKFALKAYQSYAWNMQVSKMGKGKPVSYSFGDMRCGAPSKRLAYPDFSLPDWYGIDVPQGFRETSLKADIVSCKVVKDTVRLHFFLPRGAYATVFLRQLDAFI